MKNGKQSLNRKSFLKIKNENRNWGLKKRNGYPQFNVKLWITIKGIIIKL